MRHKYCFFSLASNFFSRLPDVVSFPFYCVDTLQHISTSAPQLAPTITNTDMYVYIWMFFLDSALSTPLQTPKVFLLDPWSMAWLWVTWTPDVLRQSHSRVNANMYLSSWDHGLSGANSDTTLHIHGSAIQAPTTTQSPTFYEVFLLIFF